MLADLDRQIGAIQAELQVLAVSPSLQNGDFPAFDRQMRAALKIRGTSIVLHDTTGQQLLSTNRPFGEPLPRATNTEMHDRVVATGRPQISDLIIGAVLRRPILVMGLPVFRDGQVAYVLAMGLGPEILSSLLEEEHLPPDWTAGIFDRKGIIVARNRELDRFLGKPVSPTLLEAMRGTVESRFPSVTSEGISVYSTFRRSPITGWTVAIGLHREFVDAPLRRAQLLAFGAGAAVLVLSLILGWWMAQAIRRPVEALTAATQALGRGELIGPLVAGVRELDQVGDELRNTATALTRHREQLEIIAAKLTAVRQREIRRLIINLPPRHLKSLMASIAFPAWCLGHDPSAQILCVSYAQDLADKLARDCRSIMTSQWYRSLFPTRLAAHRQAVQEFVTTGQGYRLASSTGGVLTGRGADIILIDDPLKPEERSRTRSGRLPTSGLTTRSTAA